MSRTLPASIEALLEQGAHHACHLLTFAVGAMTFRFAEDHITHLGNLYLPHLRLEAGPKYSEQLQLYPVTVRLQNITLETAQWLREEGASLQGQEATLERLFLEAGETVILFRGRISEMEVGEREATLRLAGELDPSAPRIPRRKYSALCVWDFKDDNCGYRDGLDPDDPATGQPFLHCPKDLESCKGRGRAHRFPGFLTITRELTESIEGNAPDAAETDGWNALYE